MQKVVNLHFLTQELRSQVSVYQDTTVPNRNRGVSSHDVPRWVWNPMEDMKTVKIARRAISVIRQVSVLTLIPPPPPPQWRSGKTILCALYMPKAWGRTTPTSKPKIVVAPLQSQASGWLFAADNLCRNSLDPDQGLAYQDHKLSHSGYSWKNFLVAVSSHDVPRWVWNPMEDGRL